MTIIAQRQPADKPGDSIVSSILTTIESQLERGTYEVNDKMDDRIEVTGSVPYVQFVQPGGMIKVTNKGIASIGLCTKCSGRISLSRNTGAKAGVNVKTEFTVETIKK